MTMIKNLTTNQLILFVMASALLLIAAFSFYLLQNPSAPLPFIPPPATNTPTSLSIALEQTVVQKTPTPTRHTSYTPLFPYLTSTPGTNVASPSQLTTPEPGTVVPGLPSPNPQSTQTVIPGQGTVSPGPYPNPLPISSPGTPVFTSTPQTGTVSPSPTSRFTPTATKTLAAGEIAVTGRVIQNGTPIPNVVVSFADDVAPRQSITNPGGHYSFITLAPGADFILTFKQSDNPGLTPAANIASLEKIEGTLPTNTNPIDIPDLEVSINLGGALFQPITPADGSSYSASAISASNPLQFSWSYYSQGGSYKVELGPNGVDQPTWSSSQLVLASIMWDGTLTDGTHISAGNYWWRVVVTRSLGNYVQLIYTQQYDLAFH
jgi:hypothetical protein